MKAYTVFSHSSITQLRKVCNHPSTLEDEGKEDVDPGEVGGCWPPPSVVEEEVTLEDQGSKLAFVSLLLHSLRCISHLLQYKVPHTLKCRVF